MLFSVNPSALSESLAYIEVVSVILGLMCLSIWFFVKALRAHLFARAWVFAEKEIKELGWKELSAGLPKYEKLDEEGRRRGLKMQLACSAKLKILGERYFGMIDTLKSAPEDSPAGFWEEFRNECAKLDKEWAEFPWPAELTSKPTLVDFLEMKKENARILRKIRAPERLSRIFNPEEPGE